MKRIISIALVLVMLLSLAGCGNSNNNDSKASDQPYEVTMIMPYILTPPGEAAVQQTEDTINDYLLNTLGITEFKLDLTVIGITDMLTTNPMDLAGQRKLDIITMWGDFPTYVDNGYLLPLEDYMENEMKEATELVKDFTICGYLDGHYYAIPSWSGQVVDYRFIYNKEMVDAVVDMSDVDTWDEVLEVLDELKVAYPDEHFLCYSSTFPDIYGMMDHTSVVGTYAATVGDDPTLVNYYATDAYRLACEKAYELRQKGMLDPEGSANTQGHDALTYSGSTKGVVMGHSLTEQSVIDMFNSNKGYDVTFDAITFDRSDMVNARFLWGIPYTSGNPSAAAKMINLIWTDEFVFNTLGFGTEGIDYVWNEDHTLLEYPGENTQLTVPYNCIYELAGMGNQLMTWPAVGGTSAEDLAFLQEQMESAYFPPAFGFIPSAANIGTQVAAVSNVVSQYNDSLIYGDVDPSVYLPQFLAELEAAGINDIITEYQTQFDAWRSSQN